MQKYFDFVSEKLFEQNSLEDLESIFKSINLKTIYITRLINNKKDFQKSFEIPKSKNKSIIFKKAYLFSNVELYKNLKSKTKEVSLILGQTIKSNSAAVNVKNIILFDVISDKLAFDEANTRLASKNKVKILFNFNLWRNKNQSKAIKQSLFIIPLLKNHLVDMLFCSMAEKTDDLLDFRILKGFLQNFDLNENLINRFLTEDITKK